MRTNVRLFGLSVLLASALCACDKPSFIELEPKEQTFKRIGEDLWWKAKARTKQGKYLHQVTFTWTTSDPKIVTIDAKGRAKAVGAGHAAIIAHVGELSAEAPVEVQGVGKVTLEPVEEITLDARGEGKPITVKVFDLAGHPVTDRTAVVRCQNEDVCRVFPDGVHGVDSGETILVASCEGLSSNEVKVKVLPTEEERMAKGIDVDKPDKPQKPGKKK